MNLQDSLGVLRSTSVTGPYGSSGSSWTGVEPTYYPASVGPLSTTERLVGGDRVGTKLVAMLPADCDISAADRAVYNGDQFEVDGVERQMALGRVHHISAVLSRVVGG